MRKYQSVFICASIIAITLILPNIAKAMWIPIVDDFKTLGKDIGGACEGISQIIGTSPSEIFYRIFAQKTFDEAKKAAKEVINEANDKLKDRIDQGSKELKERLEQIDKILQDNIEKAYKHANELLDKIDNITDNRIRQIAKEANEFRKNLGNDAKEVIIRLSELRADFFKDIDQATKKAFMEFNKSAQKIFDNANRLNREFFNKLNNSFGYADLLLEGNLDKLNNIVDDLILNAGSLIAKQNNGLYKTHPSTYIFQQDGVYPLFLIGEKFGVGFDTTIEYKNKTIQIPKLDDFTKNGFQILKNKRVIFGIPASVFLEDFDYRDGRKISLQITTTEIKTKIKSHHVADIVLLPRYPVEVLLTERGSSGIKFHEILFSKRHFEEEKTYYYAKFKDNASALDLFRSYAKLEKENKNRLTYGTTIVELDNEFSSLELYAKWSFGNWAYLTDSNTMSSGIRMTREGKKLRIDVFPSSFK